MTQTLITMTSKELVRYEIIKRLIDKQINGTTASLQARLSVRQVKRLKARVLEGGAKGVIHKGRGRISNRTIDPDKLQNIENITKEKYPDFGPTFASEKLLENHKIKVSIEKLRQIMINIGLWQPRSKKKQNHYRHLRERKAQYGELLQFDGCYHRWFEDRGKQSCALTSIDDATGKIPSLEFTNWEGTINCLMYWKNYIEKHGKPMAIYLDRHSTYKQNQKSVFDDKDCLTQFERVMQELDIEIIHAKSPQGKGRIERLFDTLQDRLVKEFRLVGISTIEEANEFVDQIYIGKFNEQFTVVPQKRGDLHRPLSGYEKNNLDKIFSVKNYRIVNNDFTIRFEGKWYQLEKSQPRLVRQKETVCIEERISGQMFITLRGKNLNYFKLLERPAKVIKIPIIALTKTKPSWRPRADHPWRRQLISNTQKS
jgi:hypothetical protein